MSILGNIIWLILGGLIASILYILGGVILCLTIIGIPFGLQSINIGIATFAPFGKEVVSTHQANSILAIIFNILWIVLFGWELAIWHIVFAIILAITIIGIPFAKQHVKLIPVSLFPFGVKLQKIENSPKSD